MQYSKLWALLDKTKLSPEQLAPIFGISNMTIRRWRRESAEALVPKAYDRLVTNGLKDLVIQGKLEGTDPEMSRILEDLSTSNVKAVLQGMGVSETDLQAAGSQQDKMISALEHIGGSQARRAGVDNDEDRIRSFTKMGQDWTSSIGTLINVIRAPSLTIIEKTAAYGALFYLLCPLDLIPDHIPIFGLTDDLAMLTAAAGYYVKKKITPADSIN